MACATMNPEVITSARSLAIRWFQSYINANGRYFERSLFIVWWPSIRGCLNQLNALYSARIKKYCKQFKKMEVILTSPKRLHLRKNYYCHIMAPPVLYDFCRQSFTISLKRTKLLIAVIASLLIWRWWRPC